MRFSGVTMMAAAVAIIGLGASSAQSVPPDVKPTTIDTLTAHELVSTGKASMSSSSTVDAGGVAVTLPAAGAPSAKNNTVALSSTLVDTSLAVQRAESGATRIMSIANSAAAPEDVTYRIVGASLEPQPDNTVSIVKDGEFVGQIAAPWALDAAGRQVATSYIVKGDTLTQRTHFTRSTAFPVVSDPSVSPCLWGFLPAICSKYNRAEVARINSAIAAGAGAGATALCGYIPVVAYRAACAALIGSRAAEAVWAIQKAQRERRCVLMKMAYPILQGYMTFCVVNC